MSEATEIVDEVKTDVQDTIADQPVIEIPAELKFNATFEGWDDARTKEEVAKYYEANPDKNPANKQLENTEIKPEEKPEEVKEKVKTEEPKAEVKTETALDVSIISDKFKTVDELKEFLSKAETIVSKAEEIEREKELLAKAKNPIPDAFKTDIAFYNQTGISDKVIIKNVTSITKDSDPLDILTAEFLLENPEYAENGWEDTRNQIARKNGVDPTLAKEDWPEGLEKALKFDAIKPLKNILQKTENFNKDSDFFASLQSQREASLSQMKANTESWSTTVKQISDDIIKNASLKGKTENLGELSLAVAVSEQEVANALSGLSEWMAQNAPDEKTVQSVKAIITQQLMTPEKILKAFDQEWGKRVATITSKAEEEAMKKYFKGAPNIKTEEKPSGGAKTFDEFLETRKG